MKLNTAKLKSDPSLVAAHTARADIQQRLRDDIAALQAAQEQLAASDKAFRDAEGERPDRDAAEAHAHLLIKLKAERDADQRVVQDRSNVVADTKRQLEGAQQAVDEAADGVFMAQAITLAEGFNSDYESADAKGILLRQLLVNVKRRPTNGQIAKAIARLDQMTDPLYRPTQQLLYGTTPMEALAQLRAELAA